MKEIRTLSVAVALVVMAGCSDPSPTSPVGPSAVRPTAAGGAPLFTFLGNAAACGEATSSAANGEVVEAETQVLGTAVGARIVIVPAVANRCAAPIEMSELTLLMYETADRTGDPVLSAVRSDRLTAIGGQDPANGGCGGCGCGIGQMEFLEHNIGPFPADLDREMFAFRVTYTGDPPIVVNPNGC